MAGSKDPFWPDGVNANLCRNHILCGKRRTELYPDAGNAGNILPAAPGTSRGNIWREKKKNSGRLLCVVYPVHIG